MYICIFVTETIIPVCPPACNQQISHNSNNKNTGIKIASANALYLITAQLLYFVK